ncbi:MAG: diacylglycerol kinase [Coriobacteriia bacterium]|nr:diacylglycerol kinase [Coriobacteriia bacterium]
MSRKKRRPSRIVEATREVVADARFVRGEMDPSWTKNMGAFRSVPAALQGLVFWNILERNKVGRTVPYHLALFAGYLGVGGWLLRSFSWTELGILLFASLTWYAVEVINTVFEYLLDELHGTGFDERYGHIKDMGGGASLLVSVGMAVMAIVFCVPQLP